MITLVLITRFSALSLLGKPVSEFEWDAWNYQEMFIIHMPIQIEV